MIEKIDLASSAKIKAICIHIDALTLIIAQ